MEIIQANKAKNIKIYFGTSKNAQKQMRKIIKNNEKVIQNKNRR